MAVAARRGETELRTPEAIESYVQHNLRWNMGAGIIDAVFFALAMAIISNETVIPLASWRPSSAVRWPARWAIARFSRWRRRYRWWVWAS